MASKKYEVALALARTIVASGPRKVDADTVLDAMADLVQQGEVPGFEDEYDPQLDVGASDEQLAEAAKLMDELDRLHAAVWTPPGGRR